MSTAAPLEAHPTLRAGLAGAAAAAQRAAYAPGTPAGMRAPLARAARAGATIAATRAARRRQHAPPYPVPVATWCGRPWGEEAAA